MRDVHDNLEGIESLSDAKNVMETQIFYNNSSGNFDLPINMRFNDGHRLSIIVYSCLFVFSSIANITVLVLLVKRRRKNPSRITTMLIHLAIADLLVSWKTFHMAIFIYTSLLIVAEFQLKFMSRFRSIIYQRERLFLYLVLLYCDYFLLLCRGWDLTILSTPKTFNRTARNAKIVVSFFSAK